MCIITRFASFVGQSWSDFWKRLTSYSNAGVEAMPILLSYHVTLDRSYCDQANLDVYITHFLVKNRLCQVLHHVTKQSEIIHSPMRVQLTTVFGSHTVAAILGFYPRPVLAFGYCHRLRLCVPVCVCVSLCVNHLLVCAIIRDPFKLGSPNLDQRCKRPWLRFLLILGVINLDLQGQI